MIVKILDQNPFMSKYLTPVVVFTLNNQNDFFGFAKEVGIKYFHELFSMKDKCFEYIQKTIPEKEHNLSGIKGSDLLLVGIKCHNLGIGWCGTLPLIAGVICELDCKQPVCFVWPKEIYSLDIPNDDLSLGRKLNGNNFVSRKKIFPLYEAGVPVFCFRA